jgi:hypothetical protein
MRSGVVPHAVRIDETNAHILTGLVLHLYVWTAAQPGMVVTSTHSERQVSDECLILPYTSINLLLRLQVLLGFETHFANGR